jgi:hypothetical protein
MFSFTLVRSEGLEPPRFYSLPPQGSASTNSATSAWEAGTEMTPDRINGAGCNKSGMGGQGLPVQPFGEVGIRLRPTGCPAISAAFA